MHTKLCIKLHRYSEIRTVKNIYISKLGYLNTGPTAMLQETKEQTKKLENVAESYAIPKRRYVDMRNLI